MKNCPKCQASISDTAKFCVKCGTNIKKYEEENAQQEIFCEECGTKFSGGTFCPECGADMSKYLPNAGNMEPSYAVCLTDPIPEIDFSAMAEIAGKQLEEKLLAPFEAEQMSNGKYIIKKLKNPDELIISVPDCVQIIGENAFANSRVIEVTLSEGLVKLCTGAFKNCTDLEKINFPKSLRIIEKEAFANCVRLDLEPPANIRCGENAFSGTLPDQARKAEEAKKAEEQRKWQIGGNPTFGSYYKDNGNSKSPIEWLVLERSGNKALLISEYGIECKQYTSADTYTTWGNASLREWLNNEFLNTAFSSTERQRIQTTAVVTPDNATDDIKGGNATNDKIFLLSIDEAKRYFSSNSKRKCKPTAYAVSQGAYKDVDGCWWWLRSPDLYVAAGVHYDGSVIEKGGSGDIEGCCVRPALWINLES